MNRFEVGLDDPMAFNRAFACERLRFVVPRPDVDRTALYFDWEYKGTQTLIMICLYGEGLYPVYMQWPVGLDDAGRKQLQCDAQQLATWMEGEA